jgi:hypothetical protein
LAHLILQASTCNGHQSISLKEMGDRLRLPLAIIRRVVTDIQESGLLETEGAGHWRLSAHGQHAMQRGTLPVRGPRRRVFPFIERLDSVGHRLGPPIYSPMAESHGSTWAVSESLCFDVAELRACIERPTAWKQACSFPLDVEALAQDEAVDDWQRVVVDRPERVLLALVSVKTPDTTELHGYSVKIDGWTLNDRSPILRIGGSSEIWPAEPTSAIWQETWHNWCKQRPLPANEVDACSLTWHAPRLEVQAPSRLIQRLQGAKSDLFKGEAWILVGDGYVRLAAQLSARGV